MLRHTFNSNLFTALGLKKARAFSVASDASKILGKKCYYEVMGLPKTASKTDIKKRYRDLTKIYHPDIWRDSRAHLVYQVILEAYGVLENKNTRSRYDTFLQSQ